MALSRVGAAQLYPVKTTGTVNSGRDPMMLLLYHKLDPQGMSIAMLDRSHKRQVPYYSLTVSRHMALSRVRIPLGLPVKPTCTVARGGFPMRLLFYHKLARDYLSIFMPYRCGKKDVRSHPLA